MLQDFFNLVKKEEFFFVSMLDKLVADIKHLKKKEGRFPKSHRKTQVRQTYIEGIYIH